MIVVSGLFDNFAKLSSITAKEIENVDHKLSL